MAGKSGSNSFKYRDAPCIDQDSQGLNDENSKLCKEYEILNQIRLDARGLQHPAPLEKGMKILDSLGDDEYLYMLHHKKPIPLIDFAKEQNCQVIHKQDDKKQWHILISKNRDIDLNNFFSLS